MDKETKQPLAERGIHEVADDLGIPFYRIRYLEQTDVFPKARRDRYGNRVYTVVEIEELRRLLADYEADRGN